MSAHLLGIAFAANMGTPQRKLVLLKLVDHCHDDGTRIFPALQTVADAAQCSVRSVQREMKRFVETGLLNQVREGGKGAGNTNEYALNLIALRAICEVGWEVWCAGGTDPEEPDNKGDTESPLDDVPRVTENAPRVTPTTDKGDTRSHPTPQEPSEPSSAREGARERGQAEQPSGGKPEDAVDAALVKAEAEDRFFNRFWPHWPGNIVDNRDRALAEFLKHSPQDQERAIEMIGPFHERQKGAGRSKNIAAITYLKESKWQYLQRDSVPNGPYMPPSASPWSKLWMANLIELIRAREGRKVSFDVSQAAGGKGTSLRFGRERNDELVERSSSFIVIDLGSDAGRAWLRWFDDQMAALGLGCRLRPPKENWLYVPPNDLAQAWDIHLTEVQPPTRPTADQNAADAFT